MSLSRFDFIITYRPGKQQGLSDALSRRSYLAPREGEAAYDQQQTILLKPKQFHLRATIMSVPMDPSFIDQICTTSSKDKLVLNIKNRPDNNHERFKLVDNLLYFEERLYIPKGLACLQVLQTQHDFPAA